MGFNTTVMVYNDAIHDIENDYEFGKNLAFAIKGISRNIPPIFVHSIHGTAALVIETHLSDTTTLVAIGGNTGRELVSCFADNIKKDDVNLTLLKKLADSLGYRVIKKAKKS